MDNFTNKLISIFTKYEAQKLINHLDCKIDTIKYKNHNIITTKIDTIKVPNCYGVSAYNTYILYSLDEIDKIDSFILRLFSRILVYILKPILKIAQIDKAIYINNFILSTNFFTKEWEELDINQIQNTLLEKNPKHLLAIRSINKTHNPKLYKHLKSNGWLPIVSRQVYIIDDFSSIRKKHNIQIDLKLLDSKRYIFKELILNEDFQEAQRLYQMLYLQKYSIHNIQFQALYLKELSKLQLLHIRLLYDTKENKNVGVVGITLQDNIATVPIVGYDTKYSSNEALYRRVMSYAINYCYKNNIPLNLSSGAPEFKKLRGANATIEYMFVNVNHLGIFQKTLWYILYFISQNFYKPILERFKL
jgi:hypothetical protein